MNTPIPGALRANPQLADALQITQQIQTLAAASLAPVRIDDATFVTVPHGYTHADLTREVEAAGPAPARKRGTIVVKDLASLLLFCTDPGYVGAALQHLAAQDSAMVINAELVKARTPRETMQLWGTQYRRAANPNHWAAIVRRSIGYYMNQGHERNFVVTDCRFDNEAQTLRALGGWLWQIKRPGLDAGTTAEGAHASATDGARFEPDAVINNSHDIKHLQQLVLGEFWALDAGLVGVRVEIVA